MQPHDENEAFLIQLGAFISNFHSLEFLLRMVIYDHQMLNTNHRPLSKDLSKFQVGDTTPENSFTDYSSLDILIQRYNNIVGRNHPELRLDISLPKLRDAVAHGRVAFDGNTADGNDRFLLKFAKPSKQSTSVTYAERLTADWLENRKIYVSTEVEKIIAYRIFQK